MTARSIHAGTPLAPDAAVLLPCCRGWLAEQAHRQVMAVSAGGEAGGGGGAAGGRPARARPDVHRHAGDAELSWDGLLDALSALEGSAVAVRVVEPAERETLAVVLRGTLAAARHDRPPTVFWPVHAPAPPPRDDVEEPGIYLHRERFAGALSRAGGTVLVIEQGPLVVNVRRI